MTVWSKIENQHQLKELCTLGVGGPAQYFIEVRQPDEMQEAIVACREKGLRYLILGKGSNCLFDDRGFLGVIIHNKIDFFEEISPGTFHVGAGYSFALLGTQTARKGWSGLEFASGIPGTVGGAIFMNAGANGMEICTSLTSVEFMDQEGRRQHLQKKQLNFDYRTSSFHTLTGAIISATFALKPNEEARSRQHAILNYRTETQPYGAKSAGCMFRNPPNEAAGALIEACGLKGYRLGGAQVSEVHANFLVNTGQGSSQDIKELLEFVKERVKEKTGIELKHEICMIDYK